MNNKNNISYLRVGVLSTIGLVIILVTLFFYFSQPKQNLKKQKATTIQKQNKKLK